MTIAEITALRLERQLLAGACGGQPGEVIAALGALQAQDFAGALWSVGLRLREATESSVEAAIAARQIVRTWAFRGTLHFVAPQDLRAWLGLVAPRLIAASATRQRQLEIDATVLQRTRQLFRRLLRNGNAIPREDLMGELDRAGIRTGQQRGYHLLWRLSLEQLVCFGPRAGKQHTIVLLDDWLPADDGRSRGPALPELARRYFTSRGPATLADFSAWSGLKITDARAGLATVERELEHASVAGVDCWFSPETPPDREVGRSVLLLPGFDEYLLGYRDRDAAVEPAHAPKLAPTSNGLLAPTLVIGGRVRGTWKRTLARTHVAVVITPFTALKRWERVAAGRAAEELAAFLGRPLRLHFDPPG